MVNYIDIHQLNLGPFAKVKIFWMKFHTKIYIFVFLTICIMHDNIFLLRKIHYHMKDKNIL
jgi:hypothetical protein